MTEQEATPTPAIEAPEPEPQAYCPQCGAGMDAEQRYCTSCGWDAERPWLEGRELPLDQRGWVWIRDQDSECFSSPTVDSVAYGMTWAAIPGGRGATCNRLTGQEGPRFRAQPGYDKCNAYGGDTPCDLARALICVGNP